MTADQTMQMKVGAGGPLHHEHLDLGQAYLQDDLPRQRMLTEQALSAHVRLHHLEVVQCMMIEETIPTQAGLDHHLAVTIQLGTEASKNKLVKEMSIVHRHLVHLLDLGMPVMIDHRRQGQQEVTHKQHLHRQVHLVPVRSPPRPHLVVEAVDSMVHQHRHLRRRAILHRHQCLLRSGVERHSRIEPQATDRLTLMTHRRTMFLLRLFLPARHHQPPQRQSCHHLVPEHRPIRVVQIFHLLAQAEVGIPQDLVIVQRLRRARTIQPQTFRSARHFPVTTAPRLRTLVRSASTQPPHHRLVVSPQLSTHLHRTLSLLSHQQHHNHLLKGNLRHWNGLCQGERNIQAIMD